jgi:rare lipoprotein A
MRRTIGLSFALLVVSAPTMAKEAQPAHHNQPPSAKSKASGGDTAIDKSQAKRHPASDKAASRSRSQHAGRPHQTAEAVPQPNRHAGPFQVVGHREVGSAAWYGGRHLGHRTASGERLDAVRATAAHRSLPLHSLVRVTNLSNGRSVIATINDRGPVSRSLLIDLSPSCAKELDMVHAGIATVAVEPVVPAAAPAQ